MQNENRDERELKFCDNRLDIEFRDICYYSSVKKAKKSNHKPILQNISGKFQSGCLTAILGPSGAGKTTLLNVLSGFKTTGLSGSIRVNGAERDVKRFRKQSCYIPQEIALFPNLTTRETLEYAAQLKLDSKFGRHKMNELVSEVMDILGLENIADGFVSKQSGGEKKRLSIGLEILTNPPVMFFDEPTSGLDSISAWQVVSYLKSLADNGRTVICTIHQPSSRLFEMFDDLYLIAEGQCLYSGPIEEMTRILEEEGFSCPNFYNRADFAIEIACGLRGSTVDNLIERFTHKEDTKHYQENSICEDSAMLITETKECIEMSSEVSSKKDSNSDTSYPISTFSQFKVLFKRSMLCSTRELLVVQIRVIVHVFVGVLMGIVYYNAGNDASKIFNNLSCIFFFSLFIFYANAMPSVVGIPQDLRVFLREHLNNWYSLKAYYFAKLFTDIPLLVICATVFLVPAYYLTNQPLDSGRPIKFWLICLFLTVIAQSFGLMIGASFEDPQFSLFILPSSTIPMMLFSGFFLNLQDVPKWLDWLTHISYFRYSFEGSMQCIYGKNRTRFVCDEPYCYFNSPEELLEEFNMIEAVYEYDLVGLIIWSVVAQIAVLYVIKWRVYTSR